MSCTLWGHRRKGESVLAHSDNAAVVAIINSVRRNDKLVRAVGAGVAGAAAAGPKLRA